MNEALSESLRELQNSSNSRPDSITQKLEAWRGDKNITPRALGLSIKDGARISRQFGEQVITDTDLGGLVDGIIPADIVFNPDLSLGQISTPNGPVKIEKYGRPRQFLENTFRNILKINTAAAQYAPYDKIIRIIPKLDRFSTVAAVSKGDLRSIVGPSLAHEALHAYQDIEHKPIDQAEAKESIRRALLF